MSDYLDWFEDAYFLFTVRIFDASLSRSKTNPKKIYCVDHAMFTSVSSGLLINTGHLLENLVFMGLRRVSPEIYYCKPKSGLEVDFVAQIRDIVTRKKEKEIEVDSDKIEVVPSWRFLLHLPGYAKKTLLTLIWLLR